MSRFTNSRENLSGRADHSQRLNDSAFPITADPAHEKGAFRVTEDGQIYYSNGLEWIVPSEEVEISRPTARVPTTATEQSQLRISEFRSPVGLTQLGALFEISVNGIDFEAVEERLVNGEFVDLYQLLHPEDGFSPGDTVFWRAKYLGTDGDQSSFSLPYRQTFPDLITTPEPLTRQNAITGTVTLTPFDSPDVFGLLYTETQVEFYAVGDVPGVDTPLSTVTQQAGTVTTAPLPPLVPGASYVWRGRYGGQINIGAPTVYSDWSDARTIFLGAASIILEYDLDEALARTIRVPINTLGNPPKPLNVTVNWGDGSTNTYTTAGIKSKTYAAGFTPAEGRVVVTISGVMDWYGTADAIDQSGLVRVENIGFQMGMESLHGAFRGTKAHLVYITPNLPETVTSLEEAFRESVCAAHLSGMDTRNIRSFRRLFYLSIGAGPNCAGWDVRSVTDVYRAFENSQMNSPFTLGNWEILAKTSEMFASTIRSFRVLFDQPISYWDMSNVTDMSRMFWAQSQGTSAIGGCDFNQPIGAWDVSNVVNFTDFMGTTDQENIAGFHSFNQPLDAWNVSAAKTMEGMFCRASNFNQPINSWNVSNVTNFSRMFNHPVNVGFRLADFNRPVGAWDVSSAINMDGIFAGTQFDQPLSSWNVSNVTNMANMFRSCPFNQPIGSWDVSSVRDMGFMFASASTNQQRAFFDQDIGAWDVSNVTDMEAMFGAVGAGNSQRSDFNNGGSPSIAAWDVSNVTNMRAMFRSGDSNSVNSYHRFNQPIGAWDISHVEILRDMFRGCRQSFDQDISQWPLRALGVDLTDFMAIDVERAFSEANYSRLLTGWANRVASISGPLNVAALFEARRFNTTAYQPGSRFTNAVAGRAFLTTARSLSVAGATTPAANGAYPLNAATSVYLNADGWYFLKTGPDWTLYDPDDSAQATGTGTAPWDASTWTGPLAAATVLINGAAWTIAGDTPA